MKHIRLRLLPLLLVTACAEPIDFRVVTSTAVDRAGGVAISPDGKVALAVPAAALSSPTVITIEELRAPLPRAVVGGVMYRLGPTGLTLTAPIALTVDADSGASLTLATWSGGTPTPIASATYDPATGQLRASLSLLTDVAITTAEPPVEDPCLGLRCGDACDTGRCDRALQCTPGFSSSPCFDDTRIAYLVSTSAAGLVVDPTVRRARAISDLIQSRSADPSTRIWVAAYDAVFTALTPTFVQSPDALAIDARVQMSDRLSDLQTGLSALHVAVQQELATGASTGTDLEMIIAANAIPSPLCTGVAATETAPICTIERVDWPSTFSLPPSLHPDTQQPWTWPQMQALYPEMTVGQPYNDDATLRAKVSQLILSAQASVGRIRLHVVLFTDESRPEYPNLPQVRALYRSLATLGGGEFVEVPSTSTMTVDLEALIRSEPW